MFANSFTSAKPSHMPRVVYLQQKAPKTGKTSNLPPTTCDQFGLCLPFRRINAKQPFLWEMALLFRQHSKTFASLDRTNCSTDITRGIIATLFSKRASGMASLTNLARVDCAFFQFAMTNDLPPAGEDARVTVAQWIKPMRERGYAAPRGALYALRVVNESIELQLPLTSPAVLGVARTHRSKLC